MPFPKPDLVVIGGSAGALESLALEEQAALARMMESRATRNGDGDAVLRFRARAQLADRDAARLRAVLLEKSA